VLISLVNEQVSMQQLKIEYFDVEQDEKDPKPFVQNGAIHMQKTIADQIHQELLSPHLKAKCFRVLDINTQKGVWIEFQIDNDKPTELLVYLS
jgi:beta-lactamase class D